MNVFPLDGNQSKRDCHAYIDVREGLYEKIQVSSLDRVDRLILQINLDLLESTESRVYISKLIVNCSLAFKLKSQFLPAVDK